MVSNKKIFLIRHAESESNAGGVFEHKNIIKITETGKKQAQDLAEILDKPDRIIVSKYIRTVETAEPTIKKYPDSKVHLWLDTHEFEYVDTIRYRNISSEQRDLNAREYWERADPYYKDAETVENFVEMVERANRVILKLKKIPDGVNYVFSHGLFMRTMYDLFLFFPNFNSMEKTPELYKEIFEKFDIIYSGTEISFHNTTILDITELVEKYAI